MTILHLGSGGGDTSGGNGGGALKIECVQFENNGIIEVNGGGTTHKPSGGGSGGSIFIICNEFKMNDKNIPKLCYIAAVGGRNDEMDAGSLGKGGNGGMGRIRITCRDKESVEKYVKSLQIRPEPFIG